MSTLQKWIDSLPHAAWLGMQVVELGHGRARIRLPYHETLMGDPVRGTLHGGVISTLMDTTGGAAVWSAQAARLQATLDLRIDYLRPAAAGSDLLANAHCYRTRRHVVFVRGECFDQRDQEPLAHMTAVFALQPAHNAVQS